MKIPFLNRENKNQQLRSHAINIIVAAVVIIIVVVAYMRYTAWRGVFLTNNQAYFGHVLWVPFSSTVTLRDVYYVQMSGPIQPASEGNQPQLTVIKLGSEIHGPRDVMMIPKSSVLFFEDLRADAPIVRAIEEYQNKQAQ